MIFRREILAVPARRLLVLRLHGKRSHVRLVRIGFFLP